MEARGEPGPLHYAIARISNPVDKPATGRMKSSFLGQDEIGSAMTRVNIAAFLIAQLTDPPIPAGRAGHQRLRHRPTAPAGTVIGDLSDQVAGRRASHMPVSQGVGLPRLRGCSH